MGNFNIYPVPQMVEKHDSDGQSFLAEDFVINDSAYSADSYYPSLVGKIAEFANIREQRVARVEIYPIQFNAVANKLKI